MKIRTHDRLWDSDCVTVVRKSIVGVGKDIR